MAVTSFASGTQTATVTTEHSLASVNTSGVFVLHVDRVNMAAGDVLELRVKKITLAGGTKRGGLIGYFYGAPLTDDTWAQSRAIPNDLTDTDSIEFTLKQTFGTGRNYPYKVIKLL